MTRHNVTPQDVGSPSVALTISQAVKYSSLSRSFIYNLFWEKRLTRLKAGKRVLIMKADMDAYLNSIRQVG